MKYSDKKNRQRLYLYTHISYISYTYPIHITLVVPSRQCLFTYWYVYIYNVWLWYIHMWCLLAGLNGRNRWLHEWSWHSVKDFGLPLTGRMRRMPRFQHLPTQLPQHHHRSLHRHFRFRNRQTCNVYHKICTRLLYLVSPWLKLLIISWFI